MKDLIATSLKKCRKDLGLKQKDIALFADIALSNYSNYEKGNYPPSYDDLRKFCKTFGISADYLIGITNEMRLLCPLYPPKRPVEPKDILGKSCLLLHFHSSVRNSGRCHRLH